MTTKATEATKVNETLRGIAERFDEPGDDDWADLVRALLAARYPRVQWSAPADVASDCRAMAMPDVSEAIDYEGVWTLSTAELQQALDAHEDD